MNAEAITPDGQDVHPTKGQSLGLIDVSGRADGERLSQRPKSLLAFFDEDDPEGLLLIEAFINHKLIALLKDVKFEGHAREQNCIERKQRQLVHRSDLGNQSFEPGELSQHLPLFYMQGLTSKPALSPSAYLMLICA
jgi:hypothetical protein